MPTGRCILIVDDDAGVRKMLADCLADDHGFTIFTAKTLVEAEAIIADADRRLDALILEIGLPDGDGREFCAKLRRQGHGMPILILTDRNDEADIVSGLGCGANDYIAKPFRLNELLARLRAQLRLFDSSGEAICSIGPYTFHPAKKLLQHPAKNRRVRLTTKEVAILRFLYRSDGCPVDRKILMREVWGYDATVTTHRLETHIYRLRMKIESDPSYPDLLLTEPGAYRLNLPMGAAGSV
jgi:DNA-binding response OmpR family regulator